MIQIIQTPGEINAAYGINAVSLTGIVNSNTRYKLEIYNDTDTALISSLVIAPNGFGNGVVDIKYVLQTLIRPGSINQEKSETVQGSFNETKQYILKAIEVDLLDNEIGTAVQSPILLTTGGRKTGWEVEYVLPTGALTDLTTSRLSQNILPNPSIPNNTLVKDVKLTKEDYYTISYKNTFSNYIIYPYINGVAQTPIVKSNTLPNEYPSLFITVPVGFNNLNLSPQIDSYFINISDEWWYFDSYNEECDFEPIQLSWLNSYGFRDFYTFTKRTDKRTNVSRNTYNKSVIDFNFINLQTEKGVSGDTIYSQEIKNEFTIRTDFVSEKESVYFENLIVSPQVRANIKGDYFDVKPLTNTWNLQRFRTDNLFQFEYAFEIATKINSQRA